MIACMLLLLQEIDRLNKVVVLTLSTLKNLRLAIAGTIALNDELLQALDTLFNARVPQKWLKIRQVCASVHPLLQAI